MTSSYPRILRQEGEWRGGTWVSPFPLAGSFKKLNRNYLTLRGALPTPQVRCYQYQNGQTWSYCVVSLCGSKLMSRGQFAGSLCSLMK